MDSLEQAQKVIIELETELESLKGRHAVLIKMRDQLSYGARTGDKAAKSKLQQNNVETTTIVNDIEIVEAALREAKSRLGVAEVNAADAADQATALKIQELQKAFVERLEAIHEACEDIAKFTQENKLLLSDMHRLGVTAPSHDSVRINSVLALKTMLMGCPWNVQEFEGSPHFLSPAERKYFKPLANAWGAAIDRQIEQRLPKKKDAA